MMLGARWSCSSSPRLGCSSSRRRSASTASARELAPQQRRVLRDGGGRRRSARAASPPCAPSSNIGMSSSCSIEVDGGRRRSSRPARRRRDPTTTARSEVAIAGLGGVGSGALGGAEPRASISIALQAPSGLRRARRGRRDTAARRGPPRRRSARVADRAGVGERVAHGGPASTEGRDSLPIPRPELVRRDHGRSSATASSRTRARRSMQVLGHKDSDLLGSSLLDLVHPDDVSQTKAFLDR